MKAACKIDPPSWMTDDATIRVMRALGAFNVSPDAMFVGGCVRNVLLGRPVSDIDIATKNYPETVIRKLESTKIKPIPTGIEHGTITAVLDGRSFEITTLRRDVETDGRRAVVSYTDDWYEDAQRRDFTMNTLLANMDGEIFDPAGDGVSDLQARRVRFVGDAAARIAEDHLRILRFFRFHAQYGEGTPDDASLIACRDGANGIDALSRERITQEFLKIMAVAEPVPTLALMFRNGVLEDMGQAFNKDRMAYFCRMQTRHDCVDIIARLFMLAGMKAEPFETRLILSNAQKKMLETLATGMEALKKAPSRKILRALIYRIGNAAAAQAYLLNLAQRDAPVDSELLDLARYWQPPVFPVKGEDLIAAGYAPGPEMGAVLAELEEGWIKKDFSDRPVKIPQKK